MGAILLLALLVALAGLSARYGYNSQSGEYGFLSKECELAHLPHYGVTWVHRTRRR